MDWYYVVEGQRQGPVEIEVLKTLVREGKLTDTSPVWNNTMGEKWAKVSDIPVLGGLKSAGDDPAAKEAFRRKLEERKHLQAEQARRKRLLSIVGALATVAIVASIVWFVRSAPRRHWGISAANPMGKFEKLNSMLVDDCVMDRTEVPSCSVVSLAAAKVYSYSNPKMERGTHVSALGSLVLLTDASNKLVGLVASFHSPGLRGPSLVDNSVVSLFIKKYWPALTGMDLSKTHFDLRTETAAKEVPDNFGLVNMPGGGCVPFETATVRGIWIEYGEHGRESLVYVHRK